MLRGPCISSIAQRLSQSNKMATCAWLHVLVNSVNPSKRCPSSETSRKTRVSDFP